MRRPWVIAALSLSALIVSGAVQAEYKVNAFAAHGIGYSNGDGVFLTYEGQRFEYQLSMWNGDSDNVAVGVGYPLRFGRKVRFGWVPGMAGIGRKTDVLGTHWQFHNRFELNYVPSSNFQANVAWIHYSNCSAICNHTKTPNLGENFVTLELRYGLKPMRGSSGDALPPPMLHTVTSDDR